MSNLFIRTSAVVAILFLLSACGVNPVTHKRELQFVSQAEEISIGEKNYVPARQQQGGDYVVDPELTAYVQSVGNKLAAASDRQLPYEFVVLNDSVPNAWAMPGGKIAFNRGLLYELNSEAELAAVLAHEIVHAAARHGAQSMETGMLLQGAVMATGMATQDQRFGDLIVGGAQLSTALISKRFGRGDESEADLYGMRYMKKAGYDPRAAVTLQETFVRLSQDRQSNFVEGLFASHPPSTERVAANRATLAELGEGGEWGREIYAQKVGKLKAAQAAYRAYDDGVKALAKGDVKQANMLAMKAAEAEPREARFQELLGDVALKQNNNEQALGFYKRAIALQPDYFRSHVQSGVALSKLGRQAEAEPYLKRSVALLPTATSFYLLGQIAEDRGDVDSALQHYQIAASSKSEVGKDSVTRYVRLDLPRNPAKYLQAAVQADKMGGVYAVVMNPTGVAVKNVQLRLVRYDAISRMPNAQMKLRIKSVIGPNERGEVKASNLQVYQQADLNLYRVNILSAALAK